MTEFVPHELGAVFVISPVEENHVQMRIERHVAGRALHEGHRAAPDRAARASARGALFVNRSTLSTKRRVSTPNNAPSWASLRRHGNGSAREALILDRARSAGPIGGSPSGLPWLLWQLQFRP
ncbi:hypothetical protein [Sorangium sp. So ce693]|uniref:hypothetical protein n=1 Tax=Sorangium sp. So ce693 TaxID=3133318 RepID=UPI003F60E54B